MVGRHLLIAGVPLVIATAYRLYTGSNDDLRGRDRVGVTEPVRRNNNNKKYGGKRNNRGPRASQDEVEDYDQNPYEEIALDSTVRRNCSKCKVVERKLNSYIRDTICLYYICIYIYSILVKMYMCVCMIIYARRYMSYNRNIIIPYKYLYRIDLFSYFYCYILFNEIFLL